MKHPARWIAGGVAVVLVALTIVFATQIGSDPRKAASQSQLAGREAPKFRVTTLDGERLTRGDLAGKATDKVRSKTRRKTRTKATENVA